MKQYLEPKQLLECPLKIRTKLVEFCKKNRIKTWKTENGQMEGVDPDEYNLPLFNIGQLIQFLMENNSINADSGEEHWEGYPHRYIALTDLFKLCVHKDKELIDALWEAVKGGGDSGK